MVEQEQTCLRCGGPLESGYLGTGGGGIFYYPGETFRSMFTSLRWLRTWLTSNTPFRARFGTEVQSCPTCREITIHY